tara:strand:- start:361 stop:1497 length:1137 start_codon:yes stop_codon:yes gene_type:complete
MKYLRDIDFSGKSVLLRLDLNTPIDSGKVSDNERILRSLKTIEFLADQSKRLIIISHLGRPQENNEIQPEYSLKPVAEELSKLIAKKVDLAESLSDIDETNSLILLENVRFLEGEKSNNDKLAKILSSLADVVVFDAFATSHRAHASTSGIISHSKEACAGYLIEEELYSLNKAFSDPKRPFVAVIGGSKVSTKLGLLDSLTNKVDLLLLGGGIANTCLLSQGKSIGNSLAEESMLHEAKRLSENKKVIIPDKFMVLTENGMVIEKTISEIEDTDQIFDISENFFRENDDLFKEAKTIIWNGPIGMIEDDRFSKGTVRLAKIISSSNAFSVIGGGDTIAGAKKANVLDKVGYVSTAGGAFLEFLEGKQLPAIACLENK